MKKEVGKNIRIERQKKGLSQENLSEAIGMSSGNLGKIERGEITSNIEIIRRIAQVLAIPISRLIQDNQASEHSPDYKNNSNPEKDQFIFELADLRREVSDLNQKLIALAQVVDVLVKSK